MFRFFGLHWLESQKIFYVLHILQEFQHLELITILKYFYKFQ